MECAGVSTRKALALGAISGLRSASGPAFVARAASSGDMDLSGTTLAFLGSPRLSKALTTMQLGEIVVDKLPIAPGRTALLPLLGRAASGGLVGGAVFISEDRRAVTGALLGSSAAVAAAFAGEGFRVLAARQVSDPAIALVEDAVVLLVGFCASHNVR
jgi:uncharacterized membrane protein